MNVKFLFLILLVTLLFAEANDRAVRISTIMKTEQRVALVIGNNAYEGALPSLRNKMKDLDEGHSSVNSNGMPVMEHTRCNHLKGKK